MEILFVASALKYWLEGVDRKMLSTVSLKTNPNWVIDLDSSKQRTSSVSWLIWECCHLIDVVWGFFFVPGGAPNYYPNSFTGPEDQPQLKESRLFVSGDVQRFNSANEDNVTQVGVWKGFVLLGTREECVGCVLVWVLRESEIQILGIVM